MGLCCSTAFNQKESASEDSKESHRLSEEVRVVDRSIVSNTEASKPAIPKKATRKVGRPSIYTQELADKICSELATGKSLRHVCGGGEMPSLQTIFTWFRVHKEFLEQYTRAKEASADALADDIQDISDKVLTGQYEANNARVAVDAKKWVASKLKPKRYGDRLDMTTNGKDLPTPILGGIAKTDENKP